MLSSDQIARLVKDFYQLTLTIDDHRRLFPEQPWSEEDHQARSDYLDHALAEQRDALRKNDFEKANSAAQVVMARSKRAERDLGPGEYNQIRQAILRASIDIISELRARQDGDCYGDPRDRLLKDALGGASAGAVLPSQAAVPLVVPSPPVASGGPNFSAIAEAFRSDQIAADVTNVVLLGVAARLRMSISWSMR